MKTISLPKPIVERVAPLLVLFVILVLILPRSAKFNYDYKKGSPWNYETLQTQFDFPILKTQEQIAEEKAKTGTSVIPYYKYDETIVNKNIKGVEAIQLGKYASLRPAIAAALNSVYSKGIVSDQGIKLEKGSELSDDVLYIQKDKRATKYPVSEVYKISDAKVALLTIVSKENDRINMDSILRSSGAYDLLKPNLTYDKQTTTLVHSESARYISPTQGYVSAGEIIVSKDEIVTAEIAQMLDSYKVEFEHNTGNGGPKFLYWVGNALISLGLIVLLYLAILFTNPIIFKERNRYYYLILIFLIATISAVLISKINSDLLFIVPFTLTALYLQAFFKNKVIVPIIIISLLPLLIFCQNGSVLFVMYSVAGMVSIALFPYFSKGWKPFVVAAIVFVVLTTLYFGFRAIDAVNGKTWTTVAYLFVSSFLSVAGYQVIYLFEKAFNLVSNSRLEELYDTNSPLIRELEKKAPGTFQHSVRVMNMAETVARSIDANVLLIRAGALYHDIGKMNNPECFVENESLLHKDDNEKYHYSLTPQQSAKDIIRHPSDGIELAKKYGLPEVIQEFIVSHHGTTTVGYFYSKYINEGGDPNDVQMFRYPGIRPKTKEQVILMLCDSIEAASRTLKDRTPEGYSQFVESIVASKMNEQQFDESELSIKELTIIKSVLKTYLSQSNHERIAYPAKK